MLHEGRSKGRRVFHEDLNNMTPLQSFRHFRHRNILAKSLTVNGKMDALMIDVADVSRIQSDRATELPVGNGNDVFRTRHGVALHEDFFVLEFFHLRRENANGKLGQQGREGLGGGHVSVLGAAFGEEDRHFNFLWDTPSSMSLGNKSKKKQGGPPFLLFNFLLFHREDTPRTLLIHALKGVPCIF
jgi:hypothetical protein